VIRARYNVQRFGMILVSQCIASEGAVSVRIRLISVIRGQCGTGKGFFRTHRPPITRIWGIHTDSCPYWIAGEKHVTSH
jgi:hypothetical protein